MSKIIPEQQNADAILDVRQVNKIYRSAGRELQVLKDVSFSVGRGDIVSIIGPSGSGKTTLLGICAGLDQASSGSVLLNGIRLDGLNEDRRAEVRNNYVGFIFQNFQLMPTLTAMENVMVPMELRGQKGAKARALELLEKVGLAERAMHYPVQLSGGEQQRVSLARAFSNKPAILFADEPTGNLDEETGERIEDMLFALNREAGTTLVIVTHDPELASKTSRIIRMKGGMVQ